MYVACDGSLLKRLTLSFHSNAQFYLIRRDRKRKRRRARDCTFITAFLCGENRCCEKSRSPFQLEIIHLATRVFLHFVLAKIRGWITLRDTQIYATIFSYRAEKQVRCTAAVTNSDFNMPFQRDYISVVAVTFGVHSFHFYLKTFHSGI